MNSIIIKPQMKPQFLQFEIRDLVKKMSRAGKKPFRNTNEQSYSFRVPNDTFKFRSNVGTAAAPSYDTRLIFSSLSTGGKIRLGGVSNPRTTSVTFGSRMRNLGDGSQPLIRLFDVAGTEEKITLLDMGEESHGQTGDYIYHCESGFQVKTDDETARNGMTFQYTIDVRHLGDSGGMF